MPLSGAEKAKKSTPKKSTTTQPAKKESAPKKSTKKAEPKKKDDAKKKAEPTKKADSKKTTEPKKKDDATKIAEPEIVAPSKTKKSTTTYMLIGKVFNSKKTLEIFNADIRVNVFPYPAHSSKDGAFKYPMKLKAGTYEISAEKKGYKPYKGTLKVDGSKERFAIEFYMAKESSKEESRMVTPSSTKIAPPPVIAKKVEPKPEPKKPEPKKEKPKPAEKKETPEEVTQKMARELLVYGQTGVSTQHSPVSRMSNGSVIAGSAGRDAGCFVDGMKLPFCFGAFASSSIIPPALLKNSETLTAGYSGDFQDSAGAVVSLELAESRKGPMRGSAYFGLDSLSISLDGNLSDSDYLALSFTRGMDDLIAQKR
jgi:hypothetical protein